MAIWICSSQSSTRGTPRCGVSGRPPRPKLLPVLPRTVRHPRHRQAPRPDGGWDGNRLRASEHALEVVAEALRASQAVTARAFTSCHADPETALTEPQTRQVRTVADAT